MLVGPGSVQSQLVPCGAEVDAPAIAAALLAIQGSSDPCGESVELVGVVGRLRSCTTAYKICVDRKVSRNLFDPPIDSHSQGVGGTIVWNPELRSELEAACEGDPSEGSVQRDPTASLVHELVHALQDCEGLNPGEHELEAVHVENIYRRAAGLSQRRGYGAEVLPPEMVKTCTPEWCPCSTSTDRAKPPPPSQQASTERRVGPASSGDAELRP